VNDQEFSAHLQAGQAKVQLKSDKVGRMTWSRSPYPFLQLHGIDPRGEAWHALWVINM